MGGRFRGLVPLLACTLLAPACPGEEGGDDARAADDAGVRDEGVAQPDAEEGCPCICRLPVGAAYRFTSMACEPAGFPEAEGSETGYQALCDLLDSIWKRDIDREVQNVLYEIRDTTQCVGSGGTIVTEAGSGAKRADPTATCPRTGATECPGPFTMLEGSHTPLVTLVDGCSYSAADPRATELRFHPGDSRDPALCAPELDPADGIRFRWLDTSGTFSPDCSTVSQGRMRGCIAKRDAYRLCLCNDLTYRNCPVAPEGTGTYCQTRCGAEWGLNFGGFLAELVGLPVNCDIDGDGTLDESEDGPDGWVIHGSFSAVLLGPGQYTPLGP